MFLKTLTVKGFKSFADTTVLDLEPGVTVVVGPNGSGKSNVVDAIAWVLGAQAPSAVRSQKMDDVIFAGTGKRQPLGRAEVALTIDNTAGILPIDLSEVTITRTLWRSGDSEYALNGAPCRLLDIQELLSDSGVGRQQHVIVSQGQIDAVLNARSEDRRSIIEEAAGVLKFRRRKEKAERRLAATEDNLMRVQDLLREVRRQLRPLERQAEAARRHGDLFAELRALQLHLAGRQITELRTRLHAAQRSRTELGAAEREVKTTLARLDTEVMVAEGRLAAAGVTGLADRLVRAESQRERARGLQALLTERLAGLGRELAASVDQGLVQNMEAEAAQLSRELETAAAEAAALVPAAAAVHHAEQTVFEQRSLFDLTWGDGPEVPPADAATLRGELAALGSAIAKAEAEERSLTARRQRLAEGAERAGQNHARLAAERQTTVDELARRAVLLAQAETNAEQAETTFHAAEAALHDAEAERQAWLARADGLALALEEARAQSGAEQLVGLEGVVGSLLDLIEIDLGWEQAVVAAAGDALAAVVVTDTAVARQAIEALRAANGSGAVLALGASGPPAAAPGPASLRSHVRGLQAGVDALLDRLLGSAVVVGDWREGVDLALRHPGALVVTRGGDRFSPSGWRIGLPGAGSGATAAALEQAVAATEVASRQVAAAREGLADRREQRDRAKTALGAARRDLDTARALQESVSQRLQRHEGDRRVTSSELAAVTEQLDALSERLAVEREHQSALVNQLPSLEADEAAILERNRELAETRQRLEQEAAEVGARRTQLEVHRAGLDQRRADLARRLAEIEARLERFSQERENAAIRRLFLERRQRLAERLRLVVAEKGHLVDAELVGLREERQRQSDEVQTASAALEQLRRDRTAAERQISELRERTSRAEHEETESTVKLEGVIDALRGNLESEPATAVAAPCPPLEPGIPAVARVRELERELRIMGPINPLALEEFAELSERASFLESQLEDVRGSRRELAKVIRAIDAEIVAVFACAFADVAVNFERLFGNLFPGGRGVLRLTDPDDLLNTGVEVEAQPSGKNVKKLSLLSGGERSLTALAFLFAVFRSRPSPFYVMDEVEAALDDVNLHRFLQLVDEFRQEAQLLIVSHQKRTMEAADYLYGVSMQPGGSSKVLSERSAAPDPILLS